MVSRGFLGFLSVFHLVFVAAGCGDSKLSPVTGTVQLDGKPLPNAGVMFTPALTPSVGKVAAGRTDSAGRFSLSTKNRYGAISAAYNVAILAQEKGVEDKKPSADPYGANPPPNAAQPQTPSSGSPSVPNLPKLLIPEKYTKPEESGLNFVVGTNRTNHFDIKLQSAP